MTVLPDSDIPTVRRKSYWDSSFKLLDFNKDIKREVEAEPELDN